MKFREPLPDQCPPADASGLECAAYRMVPTETPTEEDFASHAALGKEPIGKINLCSWASCSFFEDIASINKKRIAYKKLAAKFAYAARVQLKKDLGLGLCQNKHIDFWMFDGVDPVAHIAEVVSL